LPLDYQVAHQERHVTEYFNRIWYTTENFKTKINRAFKKYLLALTTHSHEKHASKVVVPLCAAFYQNTSSVSK